MKGAAAAVDVVRIDCPESTRPACACAALLWPRSGSSGRWRLHAHRQPT